MVDFEPVKAERIAAGMDEDNLMADMLRHDAWRLRRLVERHLHYTNSVRARDILARWDEYLPQFVKVMPIDYRKALSAAQAQAPAKAARAPAKRQAAGRAKIRA
jgi:glutamate synthase domain-containing protein 3